MQNTEFNIYSKCDKQTSMGYKDIFDHLLRSCYLL